jgi:hypothetical protein
MVFGRNKDLCKGAVGRDQGVRRQSANSGGLQEPVGSKCAGDLAIPVGLRGPKKTGC